MGGRGRALAEQVRDQDRNEESDNDPAGRDSGESKMQGQCPAGRLGRLKCGAQSVSILTKVPQQKGEGKPYFGRFQASQSNLQVMFYVRVASRVVARTRVLCSGRVTILSAFSLRGYE